MTNTIPFLWNGSSKIEFFLISDTFSVRGCWGQLMSFYWKLFDEKQISTPPEATRNHTSIKLLIPIPLRANLLMSVYSETPCIMVQTWFFCCLKIISFLSFASPKSVKMFSTDFNFRQQKNIFLQPEISGWIQATMQQNTFFERLKTFFYLYFFISTYYVLLFLNYRGLI